MQRILLRAAKDPFRVASARQTLDEYNQPAVGFTLNNGGVAKFSQVTGANVGRILAIILDSRVVSTPRIESAINTADARITGRFTVQEANDLALVLRSGALPASLPIGINLPSMRAPITVSMLP